MKILFGQDSTKIKLLGVLIGLGLFLVNRTYSIGFLLGLGISELYLLILNFYLARTLSAGRYRRFNGSLLFIGRNLLLWVPFILAVKYPTIVNIIAAVLGLLFFKVIIYTKYIFFRDKDTT